MPIVQSVLGLAKRSKQVAGNENDPKKQHALIQPASHSFAQGGGAQGGGLCFEIGLIGRLEEWLGVAQLRYLQEW